MGYTTEFSGSFSLDKPLLASHSAYLHKFATTRRMERKQTIASKLPDPVREAAGLPIGKQGAYFVGGVGDFGQGTDASIVNSNGAPDGQPGLWCQWVPTENDDGIEWDSGEKFYHYTEWLAYIIKHFLQPWGYILNGEVEWFGEDRDDRGKIVVENNIISTKRARIVWE
jgi:hypothetical protein